MWNRAHGQPPPQAMRTIRYAVEMAVSPQDVLSGWDTFLDRIAFWALPGDVPGAKWLPHDPKLRLTCLALPEKVKVFVDIFSNRVAKPLIGQTDEADELVQVMTTMYNTISEAALHQDKDPRNGCHARRHAVQVPRSR